MFQSWLKQMLTFKKKLESMCRTFGSLACTILKRKRHHALQVHYGSVHWQNGETHSLVRREEQLVMGLVYGQWTDSNTLPLLLSSANSSCRHRTTGKLQWHWFRAWRALQCETMCAWNVWARYSFFSTFLLFPGQLMSKAVIELYT